VLPSETLITLLIAQSASLLLHVDNVWHSPNASHLGTDALGISTKVGLTCISPEIRIIREVRCGSGWRAPQGPSLFGTTARRRRCLRTGNILILVNMDRANGALPR
jgi:hypothetical protein